MAHWASARSRRRPDPRRAAGINPPVPAMPGRLPPCADPPAAGHPPDPLPCHRRSGRRRSRPAPNRRCPAPAKEVVKAGVGLEAVSPHKIAKKEKEQPENKWIPDELSDHNDPFQCPDWKDQCAPQTDEDIPVVGFVLMTSGSDDRNGWSIGRFHKKTPAVFWEL